MSIEIQPYTPEDEILVVEALKFTKEIILRYHSDWLSDSPRVIHADIDRRRSKYDKLLNNALDLVQNPNRKNELFRQSELDFIYEHIVSSLRIYSQEYEKAQDPKLPVSQLKFLKLSQMINSARYRGLYSHLWDDFYEGYKSDTKNNGKLIFFSYASKERKDVGEIADRLQSKYGYSVFRAHDKESIDRDEDWRIIIKENLENVMT